MTAALLLALALPARTQVLGPLPAAPSAALAPLPAPVLAAPALSDSSLACPLLTGPSPALQAAPRPLAVSRLRIPRSTSAGLQAPTGLRAADASPERSRGEAGRAFDGTARGAGASVDAGIPSYRFSGSARDRRWLFAVLQAARSSTTGRRVLQRAEALAARRGRPLEVAAAPLEGSRGDFDVVRGSIRVDRSLRDRPPAEAAPVLIHELYHALQDASSLPARAFERELEAHIVALLAARELGLKPRKDMLRKGDRKLRRGLAAFAEWLHDDIYPQTFSLRRDDLDDIEAELQTALKKGRERLAELRAELRRAGGTPQARLGADTRAVGLWREAAVEEGLVRILKNDLALVSTPEGRERYALAVRRLMSRARRARRAYLRAG